MGKKSQTSECRIYTATLIGGFCLFDVVVIVLSQNLFLEKQVRQREKVHFHPHSGGFVKIYHFLGDSYAGATVVAPKKLSKAQKEGKDVPV